MRNITVTVPDDAYIQARVWAAQRNTSVSAVVKYLLETLPGRKRACLAFPVHNPNPVNTIQETEQAKAPEASAPAPE